MAIGYYAPKSRSLLKRCIHRPSSRVRAEVCRGRFDGRWFSGSRVSPPPEDPFYSNRSTETRSSQYVSPRGHPGDQRSSRGLLDALDNVLSKTRPSGKREFERTSPKINYINPFPTRNTAARSNSDHRDFAKGNAFDSQTSPPPHYINQLRPVSAINQSSNFPNDRPTVSRDDDPALDDIFGIPSRPSVDLFTESNNENSDYIEYIEFLNEYLDSHTKSNRKKKVEGEALDAVLAYLKQQEPAIPLEYPELDEALASGSIAASDSVVDKNHASAFASRVENQQNKFMERMEFGERQHSFIKGFLCFIGGRCARHAKHGPVNLIWQKCLETGIAEQGLMHTLMHVCSTNWIGKKRPTKSGKAPSILDVLGGGETTPDTSADLLAADVAVSNEDCKEESVNGHEKIDEIATFHDLLFEPTEQTIHSRVRMLVSRGEGTAAERLLTGSNVTLHLRVFTPVLALLLEQGEIDSAFALYKRMQDTDAVLFDSDAYVQLIAGLAEHGCFNANAPPIERAAQFGYTPSGPGLFDELVSEMSEEILEISSTAARRLYNALAKGSPKESGLKPVGTLESLKMDNTRAVPGDSAVVASRVKVDQQTGICPKTGVKLHLKHLTEHQKESLIQGCRTLALEQQTNYGHSSRRKADEMLDNFLEWLNTRQGEPFTAIVDGPNVGYYMQNYDHGRFNYHQIDFVIRSLEAKGENPLVIVPHKYTRNIFTTSTNSRKQVLTRSEQKILNDLTNSGRLYVVQPGLLDDYYWIIASVAEQKEACAERNLAVPLGDPTRWPGVRPVVITNDQVRDHKLGMLEPMPFKRWNSNVVINYNFAGFVYDRCNHYEIGFSPIDFFSREIQGNSNEQGAIVWHFPLSESVDEWFCVCLQ
ncbi:hypothetical protein ACA910_017001 [Epithemia clementina (nom. ined.)]